MEVQLGQLDNPQVIELLNEHHQDMLKHSPVESVHALDIEALKANNIDFFSFWQQNKLAGIGAIKRLSEVHFELKSMRTSKAFLRQGIASKMLKALLANAIENGAKNIFLETGTMAAFKPAQQLYLKFGFELCPPFADYVEDPYSLFMKKNLN